MDGAINTQESVAVAIQTRTALGCPHRWLNSEAEKLGRQYFDRMHPRLGTIESWEPDDDDLLFAFHSAHPRASELVGRSALSAIRSGFEAAREMDRGNERENHYREVFGLRRSA